MTLVILTFNYAEFIANPQFKCYSDPIKYPEAILQAYWNIATCYISDVSNFQYIQGACRQELLYLMLAHLVYISDLTQQGQVPYLMQTATIDKISVGLTPPPLWSQAEWWLSISPYGQQILAMLIMRTIGGSYIGGSAPRAGFSTGSGIGWGRGPWPF